MEKKQKRRKNHTLRAYRNESPPGEKKRYTLRAYRNESPSGEKKRYMVNDILDHVGLTTRFVAVCFFILILAVLISLGLIFFLHQAGILKQRASFRQPLLLFAFASVIIGTIFSGVFSKTVLAPIRQIIEAVDELAKGNFNIRLALQGNREIRELSRSFNHLAEELGSIELLRSDFVNNFSHEFKTPISSIRGFARMLQRDDLTEQERVEYLEIITSEAERLTALATNILNLSKIENQAILTNRQRFNCSEQIRRVIAVLEPKWAGKRQSVALECDEVTVEGNPELLEQVWINLLDNAVKFSPEGSAIEVIIRKRPDCVLVSVSDQGEGVPEEIRGHIFDKFYQGDTSHAAAGNGLGLAIASEIVKLHGGSIRVLDHPGGGSIFEVCLKSKSLLD